MAATSQVQVPSAGRMGLAGRSLLLLVALSQEQGAAAGKLFMEARSPQGTSAGVAQLLDMRQASSDPGAAGPSAIQASATSFGPNGCVGLSKSSLGTCVIKVACGTEDVSKVDFSFVCLSKTAATKQHSYGVGGFEAEEVFDSGVPCDSCTTVAYAQLSGGKMVHNEVLGEEGGPAGADAALAKAPSPSDDLAKAPSPGKPANVDGLAKAPSPGRRQFKGVVPDRLPNSTMKKEGDDAAFFGPSACISTYRSKAGTCIIQTRCRGVDLSNFAVGVTCLDKTGDYTRYLFGKNGFDDEEIFDTTLPCQACVGIGDQPSYQLSGLVPKTVVEGLSSLKSQLSDLRKEVTNMKTSHETEDQKKEPASSEPPSAKKDQKKEPASSEPPSAKKEQKKKEAWPGPPSATEESPGGKPGKLAPAPSPASAAGPSMKEAATTGLDATKGWNAATAAQKAGPQLVDSSGDSASGDAAEPKPTSVRDLLRRLVKEH